MASTKVNVFEDQIRLPMTYSLLSLKTDHLPKIVLASTFVFVCAHATFYRILESFIKNIGIPRLNQSRFIDALWISAFCLLCLPMFGAQLISVVNKDRNLGAIIEAVTTSAFNVTNSKIIDDKEITQSLLFYFILPKAFFFHQFIHKFFTSEGCVLYPSIFVSLFIHAAYSFGCAEISMQLVFLVALSLGTKEMARAIAALSSGKRSSNIKHSSIWLRFLVAVIFYMYLVVWSIIHLYLLPSLIHTMPSLLGLEPQHRASAALLNISIISYAIIECVNSPLWCAIYYWSAHSLQSSRTKILLSLPAIVLLPYSSELLPDLRKIKMYLKKVHAHSRPKVRSKLGDRTQGTKAELIDEEVSDPDSARNLMSVVKCVMALKRKMRHRKELLGNTSMIGTTPQTPSDSEDCMPFLNSASTPISSNVEGMDVVVKEKGGLENSVDDIVDIFIPVPNLNLCNDETEDK